MATRYTDRHGRWRHPVARHERRVGDASDSSGLLPLRSAPTLGDDSPPERADESALSAGQPLDGRRCQLLGRGSARTSLRTYPPAAPPPDEHLPTGYTITWQRWHGTRRAALKDQRPA